MTQNTKFPDKLGLFVWRYLRHRKLCIVGFVIVAIIWAVDMSFSPYLLKIIIDSIATYQNDQTKILAEISMPIFLYVSMSLIMNFNFRFYDYINRYLFPVMKGDIEKDVFSYVLNHSHEFFQNRFTGNLTRKVLDIAENVEKLITIPNTIFYPRILAAIIASIMLYKVVHPVFGIILILWAIVFVWFSFYAAKKSKKYAEVFSESTARFTGTVSDAISNVMSTKLFNNTQHETLHIDKDINQVIQVDRELKLYNLKVNFVQEFGVTLLMALMFSSLVYGLGHGWVSPGDFALVVTVSISFMQAIYNIGHQMQDFSSALGACNQGLSIIKIPHQIIDDPSALQLIVKQGGIKFDNVSFHYENTRPLFNNLSMNINPGEKVGLVGYSGGGKSTFIKLIMRLVDTQSGDILIDDQPIKKVTQSSLRSQIGMIQQDTELFNRTIMENIKYSKTDASDEEVIEAAKQAKCDEFILEYPEQYNALVGERGVKLSGGQKQRIAIARAFLKNAPILLLDEATSALDSITEGYIQESLQKLMENKTTIIIAHRLSTLKKMDRILVFVNGSIVQNGPPDLLLENKNGQFYKFYEQQLMGEFLRH